MEFKVDKFYKTRQGLKVRIYHNSPDNFPNLHGAYELGDGKWKIASWNSDGRYSLSSNDMSPMDIIQEWDSIFNIDESSYKAWSSEMSIAPKSADEWHFTLNQALRDSLIYGTGIINIQDCVDIARPVSPDDIFITETKNAVDEATHELLEIAADYGQPRTIPITKDIVDIENERLYHDIDCKADNYQDHQAHILRHKDFFLNRKPTSAYYAHIQEHIDALTTITKTQTSQICNCGGTINVHKKDCSENNLSLDELASQAANAIDLYSGLDHGESYPIGMGYPIPNKALEGLFKKCECGSEKVGSSRHSEWCPKHEEF